MVFTFSIRDFIFVDFEASSVDADSCSIEVGVAWIADDIVRSGSSLIRPQTYSNRSAWSSASGAGSPYHMERTRYGTFLLWGRL
jgi:hypothetical protein